MCIKTYVAFKIMEDVYIYDLSNATLGILIGLVIVLIVIIARLVGDIELLTLKVKSLEKRNGDLLEILDMKTYPYEDSTSYY